MSWADIWTATGAIGGLIGGVAGVVSLIKVNNIKSLDLRMERGRLKNSIQVLLKDLIELSSKADQSRIYRFAAQGISKSGAMQKWQNDIQRIRQAVNDLSKQYSDLKESASDKSLEEEILKLHLIEEKIRSITKELNDSIIEDDVARDRLSKMKVGA